MVEPTSRLSAGSPKALPPTRRSTYFRITPTPFHDEGLTDDLAEALVDVWLRLDLPFKPRVLAAE